jgi:hypothetical protein
MSNQLKIHSRVSFIFNLVITILVIATGLLITMGSVLGGLGFIIAGLMISQKIKTIISNKFPNISSKTLKSFNWFALILIIMSIFYTNYDENSQRNRKIFIEEKVSILKKINDEIDSNKLSDASFSINKYDSAVADDSDFKAVKEKYLAAKKADDERKKKEAELAKQQQAKEAELAKQQQAKEAELAKQQQAKSEQLQAEVRNLPNGELKFYKDSGSRSNNISIEQYEYACKQIKQTASITNMSIRRLGVVDNLISNLLQTNGMDSIKNKAIAWSSKEQVCYGYFDIVGTYNGTTYNKKYGGEIYTFVKDNSGISGEIGSYARELMY